MSGFVGILRLLPVLGLAACVAACGGRKAASPDSSGCIPDIVECEAHAHPSQRAVKDFLRKTSMLDSARRLEAWGVLAGRAAGDSLTAAVVMDCLGNPESPMRSERLFVEAVDALIPTFPEGGYMRAVMEEKRRLFMLNAPGCVVADLHLRLEDDGATTLLGECGSRGETTVLFYDPGCVNCDSLIRAMGGVREVLAVSVADGAKPALPMSWRSASADPYELDSLYYLPLLPAIYRLAADGRRIR